MTCLFDLFFNVSFGFSQQRCSVQFHFVITVIRPFVNLGIGISTLELELELELILQTSLFPVP